MSNEQLRRLEFLERRLLDLERELRQSKYSTATIRNYTEVAIARHLDDDSGSPAIGTIDVNGAQAVATGTATILELMDDQLLPIDNDARDNPAKITYINLTKRNPSKKENIPFVLFKLRNGMWVSVKQDSVIHFKSPSGGIPARVGLQMGSASCFIYASNETGLKTLTTRQELIYCDSGSAVGPNKECIAAYNDAGLPVVVVEDC